MKKNKTITGVVMALLLLVFVVGVVHLFVLRFEAGDVYPAYSSLRSDPLGTRALYEGLENIDSLSVGRNYHLPPSTVFDEPQTTFFYLGVSADEFDSVPEELIRLFDRLTHSGGRLVLTFSPVTKKYEKKASKRSVKKKDANIDKTDPQDNGDSPAKQPGDKSNPAAAARRKSGSQEVSDQRTAEDPGPGHRVSVRKSWGIKLAFKKNLPVKDDKPLAIDATSTRKGLPPVITWHTNLYFDLIDDAWQTLYSYDGLPLIVERAYGKGSILVCADSFFISNEAMWSERHPRLLVWLIGKHSNIIFDEAHFGIYKQPSVAQLIRRHRFHWLFAALAVLALLFVWKSAAYFVPPPAEDARSNAAVVSEKDYTQGLIALLRRNIAGNQLLQACAREWEQTFKKSRPIRAATLERIRDLAGSGSTDSKTRQDPVKAFRKISQLISEEKGYE